MPSSATTVPALGLSRRPLTGHRSGSFHCCPIDDEEKKVENATSIRSIENSIEVGGSRHTKQIPYEQAFDGRQTSKAKVLGNTSGGQRDMTIWIALDC